MEKEYKMALSYAHKDEKIAGLIQTELENIFADRFFMDVPCSEELAAGKPFEKQLQDIFNRSEYVIILYSKNYLNGTFTLTEMEAILQREDQYVFFININNCELPKGRSYTYSLLGVPEIGEERQIVDEDVRKQIYDIIHNKIKKNLIIESVNMKKTEKRYGLNVQTIFTAGNDACWKMDYDWNLLGRAFIEKESRMIRSGYSWQELWQYVQNDFLWIKGELNSDFTLKIRLNCHLSVAYKLGQIYGDLGQGSGRRNLELISSNRQSDIKFALKKEIRYDTDKFDFCEEYEGNDPESRNFVWIISIKSRNQGNILETVKDYLKEQGYQYRKICLFRKEMLIEDANTLENIGEYLRKGMRQCSENCGVYSGYTMHLFPDTTAPLMFALGARTIVPGELVLYEFNPNKGSYERSLVK